MKKMKGGLRFHREIPLPQTVQVVSLTDDVFFPLAENYERELLVVPGEPISVGQKLVHADRWGLPVFSSVSGEVLGVQRCDCADGKNFPCLRLKNDGQYREWNMQGLSDPEKWTGEAILHGVESAGICGSYGVLADRLKEMERESISQVILCCSGTEPFCFSNEIHLQTKPDMVLHGIQLWRRFFPNATINLIFDSHDRTLLKQLGAFFSELEQKAFPYRILTLPMRYPQDRPEFLAASVLGGASQANVLRHGFVTDASETAALGEAVVQGRPQLRCTVTVAGDAMVRSCHLSVPMGLSVRSLIAAAGGVAQVPEKLILGGPMTGVALRTDLVPLTRGDHTLLVFHKKAVPMRMRECIRCGRCMAVCPRGLYPMQLAFLSEHRNLSGFAALHGMECLGCGCCTYTCPAGCALTQSILCAQQEYAEQGNGEISSRSNDMI